MCVYVNDSLPCQGGRWPWSYCRDTTPPDNGRERREILPCDPWCNDDAVIDDVVIDDKYVK